MIHLLTKMRVADNSGAKIVKCIKVLGSTGKKVARVGDVVAVSVKECMPRMKVSSGQVCYAVIIRTKSPVIRKDGSYVCFDENAAVLVNKKGELFGTRVFGPVPRELRYAGYLKIVSLASEVF